jgi:hypothetical protein
MAYFLSPIGNEQQFDANGDPLVGGKILTYLAGSTTPTATYTDDTGGTPQANPIILNALGLPDSSAPIWLAEGVAYKFVFQDADGVATRAPVDDISGVNDAATSASEWVESGFVPTYVSATSFTVPGDQTDTLLAGRRVKTTNTAGTVYSSISASVFGAATTVTVVNDSGTLDSGLSAVSYGVLSPSNRSIPNILIGLGQTVQDVTASRALSTTYTNSTGRPIFIHIRITTTSATATSSAIGINGVNLYNSSTITVSGSGTHISAIVPAAATYSVSVSGTATLTEWVELR